MPEEKLKTVPFQPGHAQYLINLAAENGEIQPMKPDDLIEMYMSPGSVASTVLESIDSWEAPLFCGGIVNMRWGRGEAWLLVSPRIRLHLREAFKIMKTEFAELVEAGGFRRIQAVSFAARVPSFFRLLGFEYEATLKKFGPNGEDGNVYVKFVNSDGGSE